MKVLLLSFDHADFYVLWLASADKEAQLDASASEQETTLGSIGVDPAIQSGYM